MVHAGKQVHVRGRQDVAGALHVPGAGDGKRHVGIVRLRDGGREFLVGFRNRVVQDVESLEGIFESWRD